MFSSFFSSSSSYLSVSKEIDFGNICDFKCGGVYYFHQNIGTWFCDSTLYLFGCDCSWGCIAPFIQTQIVGSLFFSYPSDFFWQFYNSLCRNLPRRYALPLSVDEQTPADENLITLHNCKATARMTKPGEVGVNSMSFLPVVVIFLTVHYWLYWEQVKMEAYNHDEYNQFTPTHSHQLSSVMKVTFCKRVISWVTADKNDVSTIQVNN